MSILCSSFIVYAIKFPHKLREKRVLTPLVKKTHNTSVKKLKSHFLSLKNPSITKFTLVKHCTVLALTL